MRKLRQTLRALVRDPGPIVLSTLTLAIGIGATITIFAVVRGVLFEGLPYPRSQEIIAVDHAMPSRELPSMGTSRKLYLHYRDNAQTLESIGLYDSSLVTLTASDARPLRITSSQVTPEFFEVLGTVPRLGRTFADDEVEPGGPEIAVLSHGLWQSRFGGRDDILEVDVLVDSVPRRVIGVMPPGFAFPFATTELWLPRRIDPATTRLGAFSDFVIARRLPGVTLEAVLGDLERMTGSLTDTFPEDGAAPVLDNSDFGPTAQTLLESQVGNVRSTLWILMGTVGMILVIACANVANLFLVRVEERAHETALKSALGASRRTVLGELFRESQVTAWIAGVVGFGLAAGGLALIRAYGPQQVPRIRALEMTPAVWVFGLLITVGAGFLFGALPALRAGSHRALSNLSSAGRSLTGTRERHFVRNALVALQVALGLVLLISSGLLVRTLVAIQSVDPGFSAEKALTLQLTMPEAVYPEPADRARFIDETLASLNALPGVERAGAASYLPLSGMGSGSGYELEGIPQDDDDLPPVFNEVHAAPGFLDALGVRPITGRLIEPQDHQQRTGQVVITRNIAQKFWPGEDPLRKRLRQSSNDSTWYEVAGVIEDVKYLSLTRSDAFVVFKPLLVQEDGGSEISRAVSFLLRTELPEDVLTPTVSDAIWAIDDELPITQVQTMEQLLVGQRASVGFVVILLSICAVLAILLASIGLYGVIAYVTSRRQKEIGVRLALGAQRTSVLGLVLKGGMAVSTVGIGAGLVLSLAFSRVLESQLFGVEATDVPTFAVVTLILLATSALATFVPARRASRTEPSLALRD